jgi:hypothetical protein
LIRKGQRVNGYPYVISENNTTRLERLSFTEKSYSECRIQEIIEKCPDIIPFTEIDAQLGRFTHLCREFQTEVGPIDNLLLGENGEISIIETKLYKNPEARRKVVGQIFDYASMMKGTSYTELENAVARTRKSSESLYEIYRKAFGQDWPEDEFIDAVSSNLKRGEFILVVVGDGIRTEVEEIAQYIDNFPGNLSTLGLVELRLYKSDNELICMPLVVTKTTEICRTVVDLRNDAIFAKIDNRTDTSSKNIIVGKSYSDFTLHEYISEIGQQQGEAYAKNFETLVSKCARAGLETKITKKGGFYSGVTMATEGVPRIFIFFEYWFYDKSCRNYIVLMTYRRYFNSGELFVFDEADIQQYQKTVSELLDTKWKSISSSDRISIDLLSPKLTNNIDKIVEAYKKLIKTTSQKYG